ncbi:MAG: hypothetical protein LBF90_05880, partial [Prevotellaceae bacterium]|nr:hypothetical protein [Prevotellaceae bacterium]
ANAAERTTLPETPPLTVCPRRIPQSRCHPTVRVRQKKRGPKASFLLEQSTISMLPEPPPDAQ